MNRSKPKSRSGPSPGSTADDGTKLDTQPSNSGGTLLCSLWSKCVSASVSVFSSVIRLQLDSGEGVYTWVGVGLQQELRGVELKGRAGSEAVASWGVVQWRGERAGWPVTI